MRREPVWVWYPVCRDKDGKLDFAQYRGVSIDQESKRYAAKLLLTNLNIKLLDYRKAPSIITSSRRGRRTPLYTLQAATSAHVAPLSVGGLLDPP